MSRRSPKQNHRQAKELATLIAQSRRLIWLSAAHQLEGCGESALTWQVLNCLRQQGPISQCEVARHTGQHPAGISRLLDLLEKQHAVRRTRDIKDRRRLLVALAPKARARLKVLDPEVELAAETALAPLRVNERHRLRELLVKLTSG